MYEMLLRELGFDPKPGPSGDTHSGLLRRKYRETIYTYVDIELKQLLAKCVTQRSEMRR